MNNSTTHVTLVKSDTDYVSDPALFRVDRNDLAVFEHGLAGFVPPGAFDVHAHLYDFAHLCNEELALCSGAIVNESSNTTGRNGSSDNHTGYGTLHSTVAGSTQVGFEAYLAQQQLWLGNLVPRDGLFIPYPTRTVDVPAANSFLLNEISGRPDSRGLMLIKPDDDPVTVEEQIRSQGWAGFKIYHLFATRTDSFLCGIEEFLPDWAWEIADRHGLAITLHIVRPRALADPANQTYIRDHCRRFPGAKLILAHAARGFCGQHTVEGIHAIAGLDNVYFDTSAICEAAPFDAILRTYGPSRLLYGSDFPISEAHGRCISVGDGFHWLYEWQSEDWSSGRPVLIGIESLLALRQACRYRSLNDAGIERIFGDNARELFGIAEAPRPRL